MNKEQIKQEAKERVAEHNLNIFVPNKANKEYAKIHAIKTIQKEIDLLEELAYSAIRTRDASVFKMLNTKLNNLKQVKTEIERRD
jgi:hypothetical protein